MSRLLRAAEKGQLPDLLIRFGIRRLLKNRLRDLENRSDEHQLTNFIASAASEQIAVVPEKANDQHYEVPAIFFQKILGPRLKYSSCYWPADVDRLAVAEEEALRQTCRNAGLRNGMNVLELGCGWGSLSLWMAEKFPKCRITSVSNSQSQREYIHQQAHSRRLQNLTVVTADMNDFETKQCFDRVISVEMFEHMRNHRELLHRIDHWLRPQGQLLVHIFCHRQTPYLFETHGNDNWMGRHFFTGGMMPSVDLLPKCGGPMSLINQWKWNGLHYAKTCRAWLNNLDAAADNLRPFLIRCYGKEDADRWHHRWRLFFMACEELFAFNGGNEWFVSHYLFERCPNNSSM
ncbi:MAG: cyclopropane-fatty-acyl-phospholipid synthase family protein [Fuerstiella sp.]|nr:cyclopropane-fatty-acyl-phospholipid synthase family protein [Fuerstiella sp.]